MQSTELARAVQAAFEVDYSPRNTFIAEEKLSLCVCLPLAGGISRPGSSFGLEKSFQLRFVAAAGGFQRFAASPGPSSGMAIWSRLGAIRSGFLFFLLTVWQITNRWTRNQTLKNMLDSRYADYVAWFGFQKGVYPTEGGVRYF